jgi:hypothetical protein
MKGGRKEGGRKKKASSEGGGREEISVAVGGCILDLIPDAV